MPPATTTTRGLFSSPPRRTKRVPLTRPERSSTRSTEVGRKNSRVRVTESRTEEDGGWKLNSLQHPLSKSSAFSTVRHLHRRNYVDFNDRELRCKMRCTFSVGWCPCHRCSPKFIGLVMSLGWTVSYDPSDGDRLRNRPMGSEPISKNRLLWD